MSWARLCMLILAAALVIRLAASIYWQQRLPANQFFALPDSESYWVLGRAIAAGEPYQYGGRNNQVFRAPAFPILLAAILSVCPDQRSALYCTRAVGSLLGAACVGLVMAWSLQLFDRRTALVAGLATAVYPGAIAMSILVLSEMLFCPLMLGHLVVWTASGIALDRKAQLRYAALGGVLAGLATLARPSWILFAPLAGLCSVALAHHKVQRATALIVLLATMSLTMLPWWVRNYQATGHFVLTTLQVGASLYDGLNPRATGASDMSFTRGFYQSLRQDQLAGRFPAEENFEYELDQRLRRAAKTWAAEHPPEVVRLVGIKFARMWNVWPNDPAFRKPVLRWGIAITYAPLLVLGLFGAARFALRGEGYLLAALLAPYFTALHVIFVSSMRYREPAMFGLIVLAAGTIAATVIFKPRPSVEVEH